MFENNHLVISNGKYDREDNQVNQVSMVITNACTSFNSIINIHNANLEINEKLEKALLLCIDCQVEMYHDLLFSNLMHINFTREQVAMVQEYQLIQNAAWITSI